MNCEHTPAKTPHEQKTAETMKPTDTILSTPAKTGEYRISDEHRPDIQHLNCLRVNEHYRNTILQICSNCFYKAESRKEFSIMMSTIEEIVSTVSAYPKTDEELIHGVALALLTVGRWDE